MLDWSPVGTRRPGRSFSPWGDSILLQIQRLGDWKILVRDSGQWNVFMDDFVNFAMPFLKTTFVRFHVSPAP